MKVDMWDLEQIENICTLDCVKCLNIKCKERTEPYKLKKVDNWNLYEKLYRRFFAGRKPKKTYYYGTYQEVSVEWYGDRAIYNYHVTGCPTLYLGKGSDIVFGAARWCSERCRIINKQLGC